MLVTRRSMLGQKFLLLLVLQSLIWTKAAATKNGSVQESMTSYPLRPDRAPTVVVQEDTTKVAYAHDEPHLAGEIRHRRAVVGDINTDSCPTTRCIDPDVYPCNPDPCQNGGVCIEEGTTGFHCDCLSGYTGSTCNQDVIRCSAGPCHNGATCVDGPDSYSCVCTAGFTGDNCLTDIKECDLSPCLNGGVCHDLTNQYRCDCPTGYTGERCQTVSVRRPRIAEVRPLVGPMAGGTQITMIGQNFMSVERVVLGSANEYSCQVLFSNSTDAIAVTPPANVTGTTLPIFVKFTGHLIENTGITFEYKPNPAITKIEPLESIINGGTILTVSGTNLHSVATPLLEITMVVTRSTQISPENFSYNVTNKVFSINCDGERNSAHVIYCPTPELEIPDDLLQLIKHQNKHIRKRRAMEFDDIYGGDFLITNAIVNSAAQLTNSDTTATRPFDMQLSSSRVKRQSSADVRLKFYIGFKLDGVDSFRNLSASTELRKYSELTVYGQPKLYRPDKSLTFKKGERITIKGEGMNSGCTKSDYTIKIGLGDCDIMDLVDTSVTCMPPQTAPEKRPHNKDKVYAIIVYIGLNVQYEYGGMLYTQGPLAVLAATAVVPLVLLGVAIAVTILMWRRKKRASNESTTNHVSQSQVDHMDANDVGSLKSHDGNIKDIPPVGRGGLIKLGELKMCDDFDEDISAGKHEYSL